VDGGVAVSSVVASEFRWSLDVALRLKMPLALPSVRCAGFRRRRWRWDEDEAEAEAGDHDGQEQGGGRDVQGDVAEVESGEAEDVNPKVRR